MSLSSLQTIDHAYRGLPGVYKNQQESNSHPTTVLKCVHMQMYRHRVNILGCFLGFSACCKF